MQCGSRPSLDKQYTQRTLMHVHGCKGKCGGTKIPRLMLLLHVSLCTISTSPDSLLDLTKDQTKAKQMLPPFLSFTAQSQHQEAKLSGTQEKSRCLLLDPLASSLLTLISASLVHATVPHQQTLCCSL